MEEQIEEKRTKLDFENEEIQNRIDDAFYYICTSLGDCGSTMNKINDEFDRVRIDYGRVYELLEMLEFKISQAKASAEFHMKEINPKFAATTVLNEEF